MKDFKTHFFNLYNKLKAKENFAFARFSDGELRILQNLDLIITDHHTTIGTNSIPVRRTSEDHKEFISSRDSFYRNKLIEALKFKKHNYYKGISCKCCVGEKDFKFQLDLYGGDDESLTWSNLWVNGNYPLFKEHIIPELQNHHIVYICNQDCKLEKLPFKIKKEFRVGYNCFINDYHKIEIIKLWIRENKIKDHVFLFSASSLSNLMIHQLYEEFEDNTFIDVGTCLNPYMDMAIDRDYLKNGPDIKKNCVW